MKTETLEGERRRLLRGVRNAFCLLCVLAAALSASGARAATFTVNDLGDDPDWNRGDGVAETAPGNGVTTLRAAVDEANALQGPDAIDFSTTGTGIGIHDGLFLKDLTGGTTINGGGRITLGGVAKDSEPDITPTILVLTSPNNVIEGLTLGSGSGVGVDISGERATGNAVRGCRFDGCMWGMLIAASGNTIGGAVAGAGNVFSGCWVGITAFGEGNRIQGNLIGTGAWWTMPNEYAGIIVRPEARGNLIGGSLPGEGNVISGNGYLPAEYWPYNIHSDYGIVVEGSNNTIQGNRIGADAMGVGALGNERGGIRIQRGAGGNLIGGGQSGAGNVIMGNGGPGVLIEDGGTTGNQVRGNSIHHNAGAGIRILPGGNGGVTTPTITGIDPITGTAPPNSTVEVFVDDEDEGEIHIDTVIAEEDGTFSSGADLAPYPGGNVTATATDAAGNTSAFSKRWRRTTPVKDGWTLATECAPWAVRDHHASVVYDGKIWVIGGRTSRGGLMNDVWRSEDGAVWTSATLSAQWKPREGHACVVHDGEMWLIGGRTEDGIRSDVWRSDNGSTWTLATESGLWADADVSSETSGSWRLGGRMYHSAVVCDGKIWVMGGEPATGGGNDAIATDTTQVWCSADGVAWTSATLSAPWGALGEEEPFHPFFPSSGRQGHSSVVHEGKIWVIGGSLYWGMVWKNDVWRSQDGAVWTLATLAAGWATRTFHASVVCDGKIWIMGGQRWWWLPRGPLTQRMNDVWCSEDGANWTKAAGETPWSARGGHTSVVFDDAIWVIGGSDDAGCKNDVWCLRLTTQTATQTPTATPTPDLNATPTATGEPIEGMIASFYDGILGRAPESGALESWRDGYFLYALSFNIGVRFVLREMARLFFLSEEYAARNRADSEFITDCYQVFLSRAPSQTELDNWLGGTWNRSQVVTVFSESEEFANRIAAMYPGREGSPARNLVTFMYVGLLDRLVDQNGLEYASGLFDAAFASGGIAAVRAQAKQMAREVIVSAEFLGLNPTTNVYVTRFYRSFLGRFPNDAELAYWTAELNSGCRTADDAIDLFADSAEFTERLRMYFETP